MMPPWLEQQQHNGWQIEILIAGGATLFLTQFPMILRDHLMDIFQIHGNSIEPEIITGVLGGWILNLILWAIWLAFLGGNFFFSSEKINLGFWLVFPPIALHLDLTACC